MQQRGVPRIGRHVQSEATSEHSITPLYWVRNFARRCDLRDARVDVEVNG